MRNGKLMTTRVAAIALSSMMVLSPLTAFASAPASNAPQNKPAYGDTIQEGKETYFLKKSDKGNRMYEAGFKKSLQLLNLKNTDFIPSVPDVEFTYSITAADATDAAIAKPASYGDATGTADVFPGALKYDAVISYNADGTVKESEERTVFTKTDLSQKFSHADKPAEDSDKDIVNVMTHVIPFEVNEAAFDGRDPGVYRYILTETGIFDLDKDGNRTPNSGVQDVVEDKDVNKVADLYKDRYIDIVIGRKTAKFDDPTREIQGFILYERWIDAQSGEKKIDGKKSEGYVPWSFEDEGEFKLNTDPQKPEKYSRYDTYDLLVDKEITGTGLTDKDVAATYLIDIELSGPAFTKVEVVVSNATSGAATFDKNANPAQAKELYDWTLNENGKWSTTIGLKNNQSVEISGLPSGSTYKIKEAIGSKLSKVYTNTTLNQTDAITMAADKIVAKVDHDKAIASAKNDVTDDVEKDEAGKDAFIIVANESLKKLHEINENLGENETAVDVQNVLIINERLPITVTGVVMNVAPYALMVIAAAIFAGLFISKKRQEEEI